MPTVSVDHERFQKFIVSHRLNREDENKEFHDKVRKFAREAGINSSRILYGLSASSLKAMLREGNIKNPLPQPLVEIIFKLTGEDVTKAQNIASFHQLGFDIRLEIDVETQNRKPGQLDEHELKNLLFEIHEANDTAEDPEKPDFELDLRIGFDRARLTIRAEELKVTSNQICAETQLEPELNEVVREPDYTGWFDMRFVNRSPLSWVFFPRKEGRVLKNRLDAKCLARIATSERATVTAELTVRRDALKVRIVSENGRTASKSLSDQHRDKMCAAVARRSIASSADEYVLERIPLVGGVP